MEESVPPPSATWNPAFRPDSEADLAQEGHDSAGESVALDFNKQESDVTILDRGEEHASSGTALAPPNLSVIGSPGAESDIGDAWGFDADFKSPNYTNSFPEVPPLSHSTLPTVHPLSHSQAGNLIEEDLEDEENKDESNAWNDEAWSSKLANHHQDDGLFSQPQMNGEAPSTPPDDEVRFEEGLPLVPPTDSEALRNDSPIPQQTANPFGDDSAFGEPDSFFSQLGQNHDIDTSTEQPKPLERKSTEQVLNTMNFATENSQRADGPMDAIAENQATDVVFGDGFYAKEVNPFMELDASSKDDNLDAMWQAALGDDELLEDEVDPSTYFGEDDGSFLEDTNDTSTIPNLTAPPVPAQYAPQPPSQPFQNNLQQNVYSYSPYAQNNYAASSANAYNRTQSPIDTQPTRPAIIDRAQSFADKSKGGYTSPYDAPMDISRPKRFMPGRSFQMIGQGNPPAPPPPRRNDSLQSNSAMSVSSQPAYVPSPTLSQDMTMPPQAGSGLSRAPNSAAPSAPIRANQSGFFEDLPSLSKPRTSSFGRVQQPLAQQTPPPPPTGPIRQQQPPPPAQQQSPPSRSAQPPNQYGLVGPEKVLPFSELAQAAQPQPPSSSSAAGRYSPGPQSQPAQQNQPSAATSKYNSTAGASIPRAPSVPHQYTPHRPSPLARSASVSQQYRPREEAAKALGSDSELPEIRRPSLRAIQSTQTSASTPAVNADIPSRGATYHHPLSQSQILSPDVRTFEQTGVAEPRRLELAEMANELEIPKRPQVQPRAPINNQIGKEMPEPHPATQRAVLQDLTRARGNSAAAEINFIPPEDGREHDLLRRWQGAPLFCWGFGGTIVTSFPQRIPRYAAGQRTPLVKCGPGGIKIQSASVLSPHEAVSSFPGPLKAKGKKKEVLGWLQSSVGRLEQQYVQNAPGQTAPTRKRHEERILLHKILAILVEYDGACEGNANAEQAIRSLLSPELAFEDPGDQGLLDPTSQLTVQSGHEAVVGTLPTPSLDAIEALRKLLLKGEREKAVWHAVDQKLWGHAMIIASTLPQELGKQVAQEFIRSEVKSAGKNTEPLAALYDIFSGSWEESIDKLVPPSARAGFQMVSRTTSAGLATNGLEGLDRWRETLSLILSNRSVDDAKAMLALGQLLTRYGRFEAAHICFIFSKLPGIFGGPDDPQSSVVLLGADHRQQPFDYAKDFDSVLLTEIYEFLYSVLCTSTSSSFTLPHLQAFKLYHADILAEQGLCDEAQQYCDTIGAALKGTTKMSPYFHPRLFGALDELNLRLRASQKETSGSWIPRPSMDKVSGSMWNRFTQFVAGDDGDDSSVASGPAAVDGPFARINGDTPPTISRNPSPAGGAYASYSTGIPIPPGAPAAAPAAPNSRYAPNANSTTYAPRTSERPNPVSQGYGLLPGSTPEVSRPYLQHPPQPAEASYISDSERSLPTPPNMSNYSPEIAVQKPLGAMSSSKLRESQISPPSSNAGNSRPSTGQGEFQTSGDDLLSPGESRYNPYQPPPTSDRYSPGYGPRSASSYEPRSASLEPRSAAYEPMSATSQPRSYMPSPNSDRRPPSRSETYEPSAPMYSEYTPQVPVANEVDAPAQNIPGEPISPPADRAASYGYEPPSMSGYEPPASTGYEPVSAGFDPAKDSGYAPPSAGYEPPSYATGTTDDLVSPKSPRKKKSFMDLSDDEDHFASRAASLKKKEKSAKDREADDAFKRAAEEDAKRDAAAKSGGGWGIGKWVGWGKGKQEAAAKQETKAHQIKFGEENAFYYDKELKKWINKKAGPDAAGPSAPTPPPPRGGPPSRTVSAAPPGPPPGMPKPPSAAPTPPPMMGQQQQQPSGPPSMVSSRNVSPSMGALTSLSTHQAGEGGAPPAAAAAAAATAPTTSGGPPLPASLSGLAPPSRPGTGMSGVSNASSIDDLIGVPQARKGGTVKKAKKGRGYVDVMAQKS